MNKQRDELNKDVSKWNKIFNKIIPNRKFIADNKKNIIILLFYILWIIGLFIKVRYFHFTTINQVNKWMVQKNKIMLISSFGTILIIFSIINLLFLKYRKGLLLIAYFVLSTLLFGDTLYAKYYYSPLNVSLFHLAGAVGDVGESINSLFVWKDLIFLVDLPIMVAMYFYARRNVRNKIKIREMFKNKRVMYQKLIIYIVLPIALLFNGLIIFKSGCSQVDAAVFKWQIKYAARDLGVLYYHYYDVKKYVKSEVNRKKDLTNEEKEIINEELFIQKKDGNTGIAKDKNLIVIQLEAFQKFVLQKSIQGKEITPNLNKLIGESFYFDNMYHQIGSGNTSDAEFVVNNSLQPTKEGPIYYLYPANYKYGFPRALKDKGYNTYACHAFEPSFWNRTNFYKASGFDKFFSKNNFSSTNMIGWGLGDNEFFKESIDHIIKDTGDKPFYAFMVALSSHHPYEAFANDKAFDVGKYEGKQLGNFLKAVHYVDEALGEYIAYLKEKDIYKDSIIVIYGDHSAIFKEQKDDLCDFLGIEYNDATWAMLQQDPLYIHIPGVEGKTFSKVAGQIDILPTIANLMDINIPIMLGDNLLGEDDGQTVIRNGIVVTNEWIYIPDQEKIYEFDTSKFIDKSKYQQFVDKAYKELEASDIINEKDAVSKLMGK